MAKRAGVPVVEISRGFSTQVMGQAVNGFHCQPAG
jgi:hypothetical protein